MKVDFVTSLNIIVRVSREKVSRFMVGDIHTLFKLLLTYFLVLLLLSSSLILKCQNSSPCKDIFTHGFCFDCFSIWLNSNALSEHGQYNSYRVRSSLALRLVAMALMTFMNLDIGAAGKIAHLKLIICLHWHMSLTGIVWPTLALAKVNSSMIHLAYWN